MDEYGEFDSSLKIDKLMTVQGYQDRFDVDEWTAALLTQARMVYEDKHPTTIRFAMNCIAVAKKHLKGLGGHYVTDLNAGVSLQKQITSCPYVGMVSKIPASHQVAAMPRLLYWGDKQRANHVHQGRL